MTILTTAKGRTVNPSSSDVDFNVLNIGLLVEHHTWVTLTGTEQIASNGVSSNLSQGTRHTDSTTCHVDSTLTIHIRQLVTSIYIGQDMTALDFHQGITTDFTCLPVPLTCPEGEIARATTEDITIEGTAVISNLTTALGVITCSAVIYIVGSIFSSTRSLSILPTCALRQRIFIACDTFKFTCRPLCCSITAVKTISCSSCFI